MTISDTATKFRYQGNASTDTFAFSGKAFTAADLVVEIITRATDALEETLTITTDYTVTIATDGTASIVTEAAKIPSATQDIQIRRALAQTQTTVLPTGTKFPAKSVENAIDRAVGLSQDLEEAVNRALKFPATSSTTVATLPEPTDDAVLAFDGTTGLFKVGALNTDLVAGATTATAQAVIATTQAGIATTQASAASVSAAAALVSENAAAASAAGVSLPSITATDTGKLLLVNAAGTAHELISSNGTSGQVLTSNGDDALPSYQSVDSWINIHTETLSTDASVQFVQGVSGVNFTAYDEHRFIIKNVTMSADGLAIRAKFYDDGGTTPVACDSHFDQSASTANTYSGSGSTSSTVTLATNVGNDTGQSAYIEMYLNDINSATKYKYISWNGGASQATSDRLAKAVGWVGVETVNNIDAVEFNTTGGTFTIATIVLQGRGAV